MRVSPAQTLAALILAGCASAPPIAPVDRVDAPRFMGDWYLLAHIPAAQETNAWNGVESRGEGVRPFHLTHERRRVAFGA